MSQVLSIGGESLNSLYLTLLMLMLGQVNGIYTVLQWNNKQISNKNVSLFLPQANKSKLPNYLPKYYLLMGMNKLNFVGISN